MNEEPTSVMGTEQKRRLLSQDFRNGPSEEVAIKMKLKEDMEPTEQNTGQQAEIEVPSRDGS